MHFKYNSPRHNDSRTAHRKLLDTQLRLSSAPDSKWCIFYLKLYVFKFFVFYGLVVANRRQCEHWTCKNILKVQQRKDSRCLCSTFLPSRSSVCLIYLTVGWHKTCNFLIKLFKDTSKDPAKFPLFFWKFLKLALTMSIKIIPECLQIVVKKGSLNATWVEKMQHDITTHSHVFIWA